MRDEVRACSDSSSRLLSIDGGFHGVSMGALSLCGDEAWQKGFGPFLPGCSTIPFGDIDALEKELKTKDVAGLIMEPIQGEAACANGRSRSGTTSRDFAASTELS